MRLVTWKHALAVVAAFAVCGTLPAMESDSGSKAVYSATNLEVEKGPEGRECISSIPFDENQDQVSVALPGKTHKTTHVGLKVTTYIGTVVNQVDGQAAAKPNHWFCYEMESKDKDVPYSWCMWTGNILGRFKLFITEDGDTYLTWVHFSTLLFTRVSTPVDPAKRMASLDDYLNSKEPPDVYYVSLGQIIQPRSVEVFIDEHTTAHFYSIYVDSLEKDGNGGFKIQLHGEDTATQYTLLTDKEAKLGWRLVE